jgi:tetratricopeptide (TPR) repeat protein
LGATLVVDGTVMRSGQGMQMTLNLVNAVTLTTVTSAILKDPAGDVAALEDGAVQRVASLLSVRAGPGETARGGTNPAAYESYVKGTGYLTRYDRPANLDSAISEFEKAIQTDPRFALAYSALGEASRLKSRINKDPKWLKSALDHSKQALQLNDQLAPAYVTLGRLHDSGGEMQLAIQELDTALKLDPRNADANLALAAAYEHAGRPKDAEALFRKGVDLRPEYWGGYSELALFYERQGRYREAEAEFRIAIRYAPDNAILIGNFGVLLDNAQKRDEARAMYEKSISLSPRLRQLLEPGHA